MKAELDWERMSRLEMFEFIRQLDTGLLQAIRSMGGRRGLLTRGALERWMVPTETFLDTWRKR